MHRLMVRVGSRKEYHNLGDLEICPPHNQRRVLEELWIKLVRPATHQGIVIA